MSDNHNNGSQMPLEEKRFIIKPVKDFKVSVTMKRPFSQ